jgi:hypothetical protein
MARAYIVVARNDLPDNFFQVMDLWPNSSSRNQVIEPPGQTGYQSHYLLDGINVAVTIDNPGAGGANARDFAAATASHYGLSTYIMDNVEHPTGSNALTAAQAWAIAAKLEDRVAAGLPLTLAVINAILVVETAAGADLDGAGAGNSIGTVEDILRILAGERYRVAGGAEVQNNATTNFVAVRRGRFVAAALVEQPESVRTGVAGNLNRLPVRGRNSFVGKTIPTTAVVQDTETGITDVNFNDVRVITDMGALHASAINGALSRVCVPTYAWQNPAFTYGGGATPAADVGGTNIPATFLGRALTVYADDGTVII